MQPERGGPVPVPTTNGSRSFSNSTAQDVTLHPRMAQSPPKNKNTQHVPCKFWLQGQCQAGRACPFSHDVESTTRPMPCKYFTKGGCKFGRKCALLHITPDGNIVNRMPAYPPAPPQQYIGPGPISPNGYAPPPGLLSLQTQGLEQRPNGEIGSDNDVYLSAQRMGSDMPHFDLSYSPASPKYGSPSQLESMATSPIHRKGLSVLDAPLPNSFDSNGISWAARYGPVAASVPSKFGLDSAPSSLPRTQLSSIALRDLHTSAYGGGRGMDNVLANMSSSPPHGIEEPITFEKRSLHAERLRASRLHLVSTSLSNNLHNNIHLRQRSQLIDQSDTDDEDGDIEVEEGLLPSSLHDLIPDVRTRRNSRNRLNDDSNGVFSNNCNSSPQAFLSTSRRTASATYLGPSLSNQPQDSKIGSPHHNSQLSSSPSRYTNVFQQQQQQQPQRNGTNVFGHVGSPRRGVNSSLPFTAAGVVTNGRHTGDQSPLAAPGNSALSSPTRPSAISMLTRELQHTKLNAGAVTPQKQRAGILDRSPSSESKNGGGSSNGMATDQSTHEGSTNATGPQRSDEELEFFDMEGVDESQSPKLSSSATHSSTARGTNGTQTSTNRSPSTTNPWTNGSFAASSPPSSSPFMSASQGHSGSGSLSKHMGRSSFVASASPRNGSEPSFGPIGGQRSAAS